MDIVRFNFDRSPWPFPLRKDFRGQIRSDGIHFCYLWAVAIPVIAKGIRVKNLDCIRAGVVIAGCLCDVLPGVVSVGLRCWVVDWHLNRVLGRPRGQKEFC